MCVHIPTCYFAWISSPTSLSLSLSQPPSLNLFPQTFVPYTGNIFFFSLFRFTLSSFITGKSVATVSEGYSSDPSCTLLTIALIVLVGKQSGWKKFLYTEREPRWLSTVLGKRSGRLQIQWPLTKIPTFSLPKDRRKGRGLILGEFIKRSGVQHI